MQAALGVLYPGRYRDVEWIAATWWGNDWVTLGLAVPLLWFGASRAARGSTRGLLLWLGILAYSVYNYAYYLFGAALNVFFPLYLCAVLLSASGVFALLTHIDAGRIAEHFRATTPVTHRWRVFRLRRRYASDCLADDVGGVCVCGPSHAS